MSGKIFSKTVKGQEEVGASSGAISLRLRRVLILIDGKRAVEELQAMALVEDLPGMLAQLEQDGYIEAAEQGGFAFRSLPARPDPKELEMAKQFIINTLKTFCGPMSHLSIVKEVFAANDHQTLREYFKPWYEAIVATSSGNRRIDELTAMLLKVI